MIFTPRKEGMIPLREMKAENQTGQGRHCQRHQLPHRLSAFQEDDAGNYQRGKKLQADNQTQTILFPNQRYQHKTGAKRA